MVGEISFLKMLREGDCLVDCGSLFHNSVVDGMKEDWDDFRRMRCVRMLFCVRRL